MKGNGVKPLPHITDYRSFHIDEGRNGQPHVRVKTNMNTLHKDDEYRGSAHDHLPYPEDSSSCWPVSQPLPDLHAAALDGSVPPSQPADVDPIRLKKHLDGIERLNKLSSALYPRKHKIANQALLTMELELVRMPFGWNLDDMTDILTPHPVEPEPEEDLVVFQPPNCDIVVGNNYIITPSAKPGFDTHEDNYPFYIGCTKGVITMDANRNPTAYYVQWLEPATRCGGKIYNTLEQWVDHHTRQGVPTADKQTSTTTSPWKTSVKKYTSRVQMLAAKKNGTTG
jgi:hypothetical protein